MPQQQVQLTEEQQKALQEKLKSMSPEELKELQKQQCIFCQIITGKIPSKKLYEDEHSIAILDINPAAKGHLLLFPKEHYAIMPQVPDTELGHLFTVAKKLSQALLRSLKASGTSVFIANGLAAGQKAQHFMIHLIPRKEGDNLLKAEGKVLDKSAREAARIAIANRLNELMGSKKVVVQMGEAREQEEKAKPSLKKGMPAKKAKPKQEEPEEPEEEEPTEEAPEEKKEERVSLDDIASLFK